jgi:hypothetical protein
MSYNKTKHNSCFVRQSEMAKGQSGKQAISEIVRDTA